MACVDVLHACASLILRQYSRIHSNYSSRCQPDAAPLLLLLLLLLLLMNMSVAAEPPVLTDQEVRIGGGTAQLIAQL